VSARDVLNAFTRVRVAAEDFMNARDQADLGWVEESVTDVAVHAGLPEVRVVQFNRQQEGRAVGADYLWWWLARDSGECFGMLFQAKRLRRESGRWTVDIGHRDGKQLGDLRRTANHFDVPAMFAVYTGGRVFRRDLPCFHGGETRDCLGCRRMAISVMSAYQLWDTWESPRDTATVFLNGSIALEDLVDPALNAGKAPREPDLAIVPALRSCVRRLLPAGWPIALAAERRRRRDRRRRRSPNRRARDKAR
jgi:hypothetical protein